MTRTLAEPSGLQHQFTSMQLPLCSKVLLHRWDYSETMTEAIHRLCSSRPGMLALLSTDSEHVLDLLLEAQRFFGKQLAGGVDLGTAQSRLIADLGNRHRRKVLLAISESSCQLATRAKALQRGSSLKSVEVASVITSSIVTAAIRR